MKYKKKPLEVEAFQYKGKLEEDIPKWIVDAYRNNIAFYKFNESKNDVVLYLQTLEGPMSVSVNDYIIKGIYGELYACKPDIFLETYEKIEE